MKIKLFSFDWLKGNTRKEIEKLKEELQKAKADIQERDNKEYFEKVVQEHLYLKEAVILKPYKNCRLIGGTVIVVLNDGTTLSKNGPELLGKIRAAQSEEEILQMFTIYHSDTIPACSKEEARLVVDNRGILKGNEDFVIEGDKTFLKNIPLELPPIVLSSFIEICEKVKIAEDTELKLPVGYVYEPLEELLSKYEALKSFWAWTSLNPIQSSREDLLKFIYKNSIIITSNGLLIMYRRVVKKKEENHELVQFVSNQYNKIKKWKKSPKNYEVVSLESGGYSLWEIGALKSSDILEEKGNLEELYLDLPNIQGDTYTDGHTRKKDIRVGQVYKEDEDKIDLDSSRACSRGLHVGAESFGFDGFGDVGVIALVNPMYVRSVPTIETNKMRVSEMFIAAIAELGEYKEIIEDSDILDYSNVYCSQNIAELEEMLKDKKIDKLSCQENLPAVPLKDVVNIKDMLKARVVKVN